MHGAATEIVTEGSTRLAVPRVPPGAAPPRRPAFFNRAAAITRDYSTLAYAALGDPGSRTLLDAMAGVGARGLRAANEAGVGRVVLNDSNPAALELARESARIGGIGGIEYSTGEACRFLSDHAGRGRRADIVDLDPFGSPAPYLDCAIRAVSAGGMLAVAATDLQVLGGLWDGACRKKYGGVPVRTRYGNEVAIRLVLGCTWSVAARLGVGIEPLFAGSDKHYYRAYVRVTRNPRGGLGLILHCRSCGQRDAAGEGRACRNCGAATEAAGPLWTGPLFEEGFVRAMMRAAEGAAVHGSCAPSLARCAAEAGMPAAYYTTDEVASRAGSGPPKLQDAIGRLRDAGFAASATSLHPGGFRTDADAGQVAAALYPRNPRQAK
ncbi:MAG: tRNA (guanine-N1)-methyltransferase [Nitrosopumilus sp.]|nr:tRNA (guanine-N1)-methyltransferase [Nitrosopumilus sp.]CAI9831995.1 N2,N2-dimethylguanosine tRNA methyltransferase [Nitrosopumilaceae archaeon]MDA7941769.1 tRNA (guanine-N1)-methyltransferase [Nitrosopumilus sp.]MDA7943696.1 tRNA (guanine-N1)-methyltransferase [Nitrosopumilus sp.]MDA7945559.1 tRNA (guanine-N1)-methyltransferase [Nitrosopumilus sp.]